MPININENIKMSSGKIGINLGFIPKNSSVRNTVGVGLTLPKKIKDISSNDRYLIRVGSNSYFTPQVTKVEVITSHTNQAIPQVNQTIVQTTGKTYITLIVDVSGSMQPFSERLKTVVISLINSIKDNATKINRPTYLSLMTFSYCSYMNYIFSKQDINKVNINSIYFDCRGGTALFQAIGTALEKDKGLFVEKNNSHLYYVITDGEENASSIDFVSCNIATKYLLDLIKTSESTDRVSIVWSVPSGYKDELKRRLNQSTDNIIEWEKTEQSVNNLVSSTSRGMDNYYKGITVNKMSTKSFFTNLSTVTVKDLQQLEDKTHTTKTWKISKQTPIEKFVEGKLGKYTPGAGFYLLMKDETVDDTREIMIMEKDKPTIYGGPKARELLGLPNETVRVKPRNHSDYDVYVQAKSKNRNLIQGTTFLYRMDLHN